jgi:hypothetical protein
MPKRSLFERPALADEAADLLGAAVHAALLDQDDLAVSLLQAANRSELREFALDCMLTQALRLRRETTRNPLYPRNKAHLRMPSTAAQRQILERDAHRCRFCGVRVAALGVRSALSRFYPKAVPWPSGDREKHGAFLALNATIDHLVPHARGGSNDLQNLVTACWPCNFGREDLLLHEVDILDPFEFPVVRDEWDGLSQILKRPRLRP